MPLHPDTAAKPQAGDVREAARNEGYAGNVTSSVHPSTEDTANSFLLNQNSVSLYFWLMSLFWKSLALISKECEMKCQMLPAAIFTLSPAASKTFGILAPKVAALVRSRCF